MQDSRLRLSRLQSANGVFAVRRSTTPDGQFRELDLRKRKRGRDDRGPVSLSSASAQLSFLHFDELEVVLPLVLPEDVIVEPEIAEQPLLLELSSLPPCEPLSSSSWLHLPGGVEVDVEPAVLPLELV